LETYVDELMKKYAQEIISGRVAIDPMDLGQDQNACDWCPYHSICKFDKRIKGFKYRKQIVKKPEEIWQELLPEEQQDELDE
jgi:ATP-dependent helicase/nuclease subunit B